MHTPAAQGSQLLVRKRPPCPRASPSGPLAGSRTRCGTRSCSRRSTAARRPAPQPGQARRESWHRRAARRAVLGRLLRAALHSRNAASLQWAAAVCLQWAHWWQAMTCTPAQLPRRRRSASTSAPLSRRAPSPSHQVAVVAGLHVQVDDAGAGGHLGGVDERQQVLERAVAACRGRGGGVLAGPGNGLQPRECGDSQPGRRQVSTGPNHAITVLWVAAQHCRRHGGSGQGAARRLHAQWPQCRANVCCALSAGCRVTT